MMWELISANRKKSLILFAGMALLLSVLGYMIGTVFIGGESGGLVGLAIAIGIWLMLTLISVSSGDDIILKISHAREVTRDVNPRLFNVVEEMKIAAALPAMPKVYIIDEAAPNAFAIGIKPEKSAVAVTAGLLSQLNRDELQGVIAHEISHISNRDSQLMTVAGIMLGSIVLLSHFFLRSMWFVPSSGRRYRKEGGGSPQIQLLMVVITILLAILAPIFARLIYLAISRKREYLADATAAQLTRYPEGLASALEKISSAGIPMESANKVTAPMFIVNPFLQKKMKLANLSSTHPAAEERIKILRSMAGRADYRSYQRAFSKIKGSPAAIIPTSGIRETKRVDARGPSADDPHKNKKASARDVMDLMRAVNGYAFLVCACGLKIKVPPDFDKKSLECPKCGQENELPVVEMAAMGAVADAVAGVDEAANQTEPKAEKSSTGAYEYIRRGTGWESFACPCGNLLQLSPSFQGSVLTCRQCHRITTIK